MTKDKGRKTKDERQKSTLLINSWQFLRAQSHSKLKEVSLRKYFVYFVQTLRNFVNQQKSVKICLIRVICVLFWFCFVQIRSGLEKSFYSLNINFVIINFSLVALLICMNLFLLILNAIGSSVITGHVPLRPTFCRLSFRNLLDST